MMFFPHQRGHSYLRGLASLLGVILIVLVLAAPRLARWQQQQQDAARDAQHNAETVQLVHRLMDAADDFNAIHGRYPATVEEFVSTCDQGSNTYTGRVEPSNAATKGSIIYQTPNKHVCRFSWIGAHSDTLGQIWLPRTE